MSMINGRVRLWPVALGGLLAIVALVVGFFSARAGFLPRRQGAGAILAVSGALGIVVVAFLVAALLKGIKLREPSKRPKEVSQVRLALFLILGISAGILVALAVTLVTYCIMSSCAFTGSRL